MRQGKAESILDYIFREEIPTVALKKGTAIDLDEKIRGYWLMTTSNLTEPRNFWNQDHHSGADRARTGQEGITQTIVAKKREEVRDDLREAGGRAPRRPGGYAEAPVSISMETVMMTKRTGFQNRVTLFRAVVRAGWTRTRSSDQSERCTKETSACDKVKKILPKRWRPRKEQNPSMN